MAHFRLLEKNMDTDSVVWSYTFLCSARASAALDAARPAGKDFVSHEGLNKKWFDKFYAHCEHASDVRPDAVNFAKGKSGRWYAQAVCY